MLENFRKARTEFAIIVDEFGEMQGVVTLNDVLTAIVGDLPSDELELDPEVVAREDGSWLVDGGADRAAEKPAAAGWRSAGRDEHVHFTPWVA